MSKTLLATASVAVCALTFLSSAATAHDTHKSTRAYDHAPIGVMGDHLHKKGEFMLSARYMFMSMEGNRIGSNSVTPEQIVTTIPNSFAGQAGQPPNLRVVPIDMTMDMYMIGTMYGLSDKITLMAMTGLAGRRMDHVTFQGGTGTERLGNFTTSSFGLSDTKIAALVGLIDTNNHKIHATAGLSLPTGEIEQRDTILTPMGGMPEVRLPYPMQLGSGTFDLEPALTYSGHQGVWNWGAQAKATIRLGINPNNYSLGDRYELTSWVARGFGDNFSISARLKGQTQGQIEGQDPLIIAPVQTAQPDFHGGERLDFMLGANYLITTGLLKGNRLALEFGAPLVQNLNGPQLETDFVLTLGWQISF